MSSTYERPADWVHKLPWRSAGLRYFHYRFFLERQFGVRVQRVSLDGGFTCPNVDGTVGRGGCAFCNNSSFSPSRRMTAGARHDIARQLDEGLARLQRRYPDCRHFLAYFQPATNTYADVERLRGLYEQALSHPHVVGLAIGTRPDCVPPPVLDLLAKLARRTFLSVEYGMQTIHARSLDWMNRGHHHAAMVDAVRRSRGRGFEIGAHVVLGLPGETRQDMLATARELARLNVDAVKLHNLYVVEQTVLAEQLRRGEVKLLERDAYVQSVVDALEVLPPHTVIQRLGGDAPSQYLVAPSWCLDKTGLRDAIESELVRRDTWQGKYYALDTEGTEAAASPTEDHGSPVGDKTMSPLAPPV